MTSDKATHLSGQSAEWPEVTKELREGVSLMQQLVVELRSARFFQKADELVEIAERLEQHIHLVREIGACSEDRMKC